MNNVNHQPGFPLALSAACLTATAAVCLAAAWGVITTMYGDSSETAAVINLAGVAVWAASIVGVIPVALLGKQGVMATVAGYFVGTGIRLALCLGLCMAVVSRDLLPVGPMAVVLVMMYVPLLFVETALVGRYLWAKDFIDPSRVIVAAGGGADAEGALV